MFLSADKYLWGFKKTFNHSSSRLLLRTFLRRGDVPERDGAWTFSALLTDTVRLGKGMKLLRGDSLLLKIKLQEILVAHLTELRQMIESNRHGAASGFDHVTPA